MRRLTFHVLILVGTLFEPACRDGIGTAATNICERYVGKLRSCGLLTEGHFQCGLPDSPEYRCYAGCVVELSCSELHGIMCGGQEPPQSYMRCVEQCEERYSFHCHDGPDTIPADWQCDGVEDCTDGSDELDCPTPDMFECADGSDTIPREWVCDGERDCMDGSDEANCPASEVFECSDGSDTIPAEWVCDMAEDCMDGSDEVGCAEFVCE